jgi:hypothetical protein
MPGGPAVFCSYHPNYVKLGSTTGVTLLTQPKEQMVDNYDGEL